MVCVQQVSLAMQPNLCIQVSASWRKPVPMWISREFGFWPLWTLNGSLPPNLVIYSFYFQLILGLFPVWDSYKWGCCKPSHACLRQCVHACLLDAYFRLESLDRRVFACSVWETWQLSKVFVPVTLPPETHERFGCVRALPTRAAVKLFHFSHSRGHLMILTFISLTTMCVAALGISS